MLIGSFDIYNIYGKMPIMYELVLTEIKKCTFRMKVVSLRFSYSVKNTVIH